MSNGKGKNRKKPRSSSSRPATRTTTATKTARASSNAPSSGGLLARVLGPAVPPSMSEMPTFRRSLGHGFLLVSSNAALVFGPLVFVYLVWLVLIAFGFVGTALALTQMVAMPPLSTAFDTQNAISLAGQQSGLIVALPLLLFRAVIVCVISGLLVEGFERRGSTSLGGVMRGLAAFPLVLAYLMLSFVALFLAQFGSVFGPGLGTLLQVLLPAFVLWALGFVPFAAVRERRPLADTLRRSYAAARTPGGRHLSFCIVYVLLAFVLPLFVPGRSLITANPAPGTWIGVYLLSFLHVGFTAAMAFRWLAVESSVPETLVRR